MRDRERRECGEKERKRVEVKRDGETVMEEKRERRSSEKKKKEKRERENRRQNRGR